MKANNKELRSRAFVIESRGGVLKEEFADVAPLEFKTKSRRDRRLEQEAAWADFDRELEDKIQRGELGVDPETGEVAPKKVRKDGQT